MKIKYGMIRGPLQQDRCCKKIGRDSALYCDCGCQQPNDDYPAIDITDITIGKIDSKPGRYAEHELLRDGQIVGWYNTQYSAVILGGYEYLGVDREPFKKLLETAPPRSATVEGAGDTLTETAAAVQMAEKLALMEQDERYKDHPGYCNKCHGFCYGDCDAN